MTKKIKSLCAALLACCMICGCSGSEEPPVQNVPVRTESDVDSPDDENYIAQLTPGKDFYGYINAAEIMKMDLRQDQSYTGTWSMMIEESREHQNEIIKEIAGSDKEYAPGSNEQLIHDLYWQIYHMVENEKKDSEEEDTEFIEGFIKKIEAVTSTEELISLWHELASGSGLISFYSASVLNNAFDSSEKVLYFTFVPLTALDELKDNSVKATQSRDDFVSYLRLCGVPADEAKERATRLIYMYYELTGYCDPLMLSGEAELYDNFNILTREDCSSMLKNITFEQLIRSVGYDGKLPDKIVVGDPGQLVGADSLINSEHLREWKDVCLINLLKNYPILLPVKYSLVGFDGIDPESTALDYVRSFLNREISEIYAQKYFNERKREIISKMCDDMVAEYRRLINGADWLTDNGKAYLIQKLDNMKFFIGTDEPHEVDPADAEMIGSTLLKTVYNYDRISRQKGYNELFSGKPFNGFDGMTPSTVNACYIPAQNDVVITAAILNKRLFDEDADYAWNLGGIGSIIGHEISHAFDSYGVKFDAYGNYRPDAMPKEDIQAFKKLQDKAIAYYSKFKVLGSPLDGKLTLGENLADISGVQCALSIAGDLESKKTVFESYARWRIMLMTDIKAKEYLATDVHSPDSVRVNAVVPLFDEFYEIYGVKEGDSMYVAPEDRIRRW